MVVIVDKRWILIWTHQQSTAVYFCFFSNHEEFDIKTKKKIKYDRIDAFLPQSRDFCCPCLSFGCSFFYCFAFLFRVSCAKSSLSRTFLRLSWRFFFLVLQVKKKKKENERRMYGRYICIHKRYWRIQHVRYIRSVWVSLAIAFELYLIQYFTLSCIIYHYCAAHADA